MSEASRFAYLKPLLIIIALLLLTLPAIQPLLRDEMPHTDDGYLHLYRAVALATIEAQLDPAETEAISALAARVDIDLEGDPDSLIVLLDGRDVTEQIRTESVTVMSIRESIVAGSLRGSALPSSSSMERSSGSTGTFAVIKK